MLIQVLQSQSIAFRTLTAASLVLGLVAGCGGGSSPTDSDGGGSATMATGVIGDGGGRVGTTDFYIDIPEGALNEDVEITLRVDGEPPTGNVEARSQRIAFEPHGLVFNVEVEIGIGYSNATAPIVYWSDDGVEYVPLSTSQVNGMAVAAVGHFSYGYVGEVITPPGCNAELSEDFAIAPNFESGPWTLRGDGAPPTAMIDFAGEWNDGSDGRRFLDGHFSFTSGATGNYAVGVGLVSPILDATGCSSVSLSFLHEIATQSQGGTSVMDTKVIFRAEPSGTETTVVNFSPLSSTGAVPAVTVDLTSYIQANPRFRLVFEGRQQILNEAAFWLLDDIVVTSAE